MMQTIKQQSLINKPACTARQAYLFALDIF